MDDLLSDFLSETSDHIDGIATYLVAFEQNPSDMDAITQIFRLVHTIKGTSGFLGLNALQSIAHAAETLIDTLRDGAAPTPTAVSLLLQAFDRIKTLLSRIAELGEEPPGDQSDMIEKIEAFLAPGAAGDTVGPANTEGRIESGGADAAADAGQAQTPKAAEAPPPSPVVGDASCDTPESQSTGNPRAIKETEQPAGKEKAPDTIRLSVAAIQRIMDLVSELVLTRNQITDLSRQHNLSQIKSPLERLSTVTSDLQDAVMRARMQPLTRLFASVPRMVRDLSVELKKKYTLAIEGADTELDRQLIETLRDPLTHLIRNCADHGIESPEERLTAGKPESGQISITAFYDSGQVHIEIADDGRGLDAARIREKAIERGVGDAHAIASMSDEDVYRFILAPGFSTAKAVTTVSGRGVGMDVVRSNIEAVGGTISLQSAKGRGSKFILKIPLTLAIAPALIVRAAGQRFAVPQQSVVEAVNVDEDLGNLKRMDNALLLQLRDELIPIVELAAVLELPRADSLENKLVVVLGLRGQKVGIIVDDIDDIQEIVVKPLGGLFSNLKLFSGNTILGDGAVILIIDPGGVAAVINVEKGSSLLAPESQQNTGPTASSLILFRAGPGAAKVIPRSVVSRILRVPASQIHQADGHRLYRYQGKFIPVLPVAESCENGGHCLILVITLYERTFGLWVDTVLDIVENTVEIQLRSNSHELLGTIDLGGEAVEFVDTCHYYKTAFQEPSDRSSQGKTNVLIVDKETGMHDLLAPLLASAGHKVTAVETAEQANKLLEHMDFGVILLDSSVARHIESSAMARQTQALCLIFDDDRHPGEGGGDVPVSKFDRHHLLKTIAGHLDRRPDTGPKAANSNLSATPRTNSVG
jgi:two-component system chemotaxis sensor kinase CheA